MYSSVPCFSCSLAMTSKLYVQNYFFSDSVLPEYVYHPINALQLLKRMAIWMPKIKLKIPNLKFDYNFRLLSDDYLYAYYGFVELHEYYALEPIEIANGKIKDIMSDKVYRSNFQLNSVDLFKIAKEAKKENYMDGHVNWLTAALNKAEVENKDAKFITKLR